MSKYLYHISLEGNINEEKLFIPRIPRITMDTEDKLIPRICVSETIRGCIDSFPYKYDLNDMIMNGSVFLYLYSFDAYKLGSNNIKYYYQLEEYVPDAMTTKETWIMKEVSSKPEIIRIDRIGNIEYSKTDYDRTFVDTVFSTGECIDEILNFNIKIIDINKDKITICYNINKNNNCNYLWYLLSKNHNHKYMFTNKVKRFDKDIDTLYESF